MKIFTDFTAGEISPRLKGRIDLEIYSKGVSEAKNVMPFLPGGLSIRPGFRFMDDIGTSAVRLHGFIISENLSYILEFGNATLRIWKDGAPLEDEHGIITLTTPYSDPWKLQFAQDIASLYIVSGSDPVKVFSMVSDGVFTFENLAITSNTGMVPFQSSGNYPRAIAIFDGRLWLAGTSQEPQGIWFSEPYDYGNFTFFDTIISTSKIMREPMNAFTGTRTVDSSTITGISAEDLAGMRVGDTVFGSGIPYIYPDTITRIQEIGGNYIVMDRAATSSGTTGMYTGWYDRGVTDWETVTITRDVITNQNAGHKTIACELNETILWLAAAADLVVGTNCGERIIPSGVTVANFVCKKQTAHGSAPVQPVLLNDAIVFLASGRDALREYVFRGFTTEAQAYSALRIDYHADHILSGIKELDYSSSGISTLWAVSSSGELIALAHDRSMGINAFTRIQAAVGLVESAAVISESGLDVLYVSVNESGTRKMLRMDHEWSQVCIDFYKEMIVSSGSVAVDWLSGEVVVVYDGTATNLSVVDGSIAIPETIPNGSIVYVGKAYPATIKTMPVSENPMKRKNVPRGAVKLYNSRGSFRAGYATTLSEYELEGEYSGDREIILGGGWDREGIITITADRLPFAVLSLGLDIIGG